MKKSELTFRIILWRPWLLAVTLLALLAVAGVVLTAAAGALAAASYIMISFVGIAGIAKVEIDHG